MSVTAWIGSTEMRGTKRSSMLRAWKTATGRLLEIDKVLGPSAVLAVPVNESDTLIKLLFIRSNGRLEVCRVVPGTSEIHELSIVAGTPTTGQFFLRYYQDYSGPFAQTSSMNWNATAAQVKTAIEASTFIGTGNVVSCTGGPLPSSPVVVTYSGSLGNLLLPTNGPVSLDAGTPLMTLVQDGVAPAGCDPINVEPSRPFAWGEEGATDHPFTGYIGDLRFTNLEAGRRTRVQLRAILAES